EDVSLSAASGTESSATSLSLRAIKPATLSCTPKYVGPGKSVMCDLQLSSAALSDSLTFSLASGSPSLKIPEQVGTRTGQSRIRFTATADSAAAQGTAVIEARLGAIA